MSRKVGLVLSLLGVISIGLAMGLPAWQRRQFDLRVNQAVASLELRDAIPIEAGLIKALEGNPRYGSELQLFRGTQLLRAGDPVQALETFSLVKPEGRLRVPLMLHVGQSLFKMGRLTDAERIFRQIAFEKPQVTNAHRWLVTIYHELGAMLSAFAELEKVAELEPDDFFAYRLMGLMDLEDFRKPKEAVEQYHKALARKLPPEQAQAIRTEIARALLSLNDYNGVLEVLDEAEKTALVVGLQADCRWSMSETEEAVRLLEEARRLNPDERVVLYLTGRFALDEGRPEAVLEPLKRLLERDPHDTQTRYQLSQAYRQLGDRDSAAAEIDRMNESSVLAEQLGPMFEQAMRSPQDYEIRDKLAEMCEKLGKTDLAGVWRRAAAQLRQAEGIRGPAR